MCGTYVGEHAQRGQLCDECVRLLPRTEQDTLRANSTEMTLLIGKPNPLVHDLGQAMVRAKHVMHLDHAGAFLFYDKGHPIQKLIHKMKYVDQPAIGYQLGRQAALEMQYAGFFDSIDIIVPIPLHKRRLRTRGYNQSEYIARGISEITGIPVDTTHVTRVKNTPKQALQSGEERKHNVTDAFAVNHPEQMYHKHILIVDDLMTTGETMRSCLKAMKLFRGAKFSVFALCKAR